MRVYEICDRPPDGPLSSPALLEHGPRDGCVDHCFGHPAGTETIFGSNPPFLSTLVDGDGAPLLGDASGDMRFLPAGYCVDSLLSSIARRASRPFFIADLVSVVERLVELCEEVPMLRPFFDVRANTDERMCALMAKAGCGFQCASGKELQRVMGFGVSQERVLLGGGASLLTTTSLKKMASFNEAGLVSCENEAELKRIKKSCAGARVIVRIAVPQETLGSQRVQEADPFSEDCGVALVAPGASRDDWESVLQTARELELDICGVSFGNSTQKINFSHALQEVAAFFQTAQSHGFSLTVLDCGGAFPSESQAFRDAARELSAALEEWKELLTGVEVIACMGECLVAHSYIYAVRVLEHQGSDDGTVVLRIEDGIYGSFAQAALGSNVSPRTSAASVHGIPAGQAGDVQRVPTALHGPTGDDMDVVSRRAMLPSVTVGDWIAFDNMGAFTQGLESIDTDVHFVWSR